MRVQKRPTARVKLTPPKPKALPAKAEPVTGKSKFVDGKLQFENHQWLDVLVPMTVTRGDNRPGGARRRKLGVDPRTLPLHVLEAAGHPKRSATKCIRIYMRDLDIERDRKRDKGLKRVRSLCQDCAENDPDIRYCAIINCPLWAHRMGKNPFNRRKQRP